MPATGEKAPEGTYICGNCQAVYQHKKSGEPLPYCPNCGAWTLYRREDEEPAQEEQKQRGIGRSRSGFPPGHEYERHR